MYGLNVTLVYCYTPEKCLKNERWCANLNAVLKNTTNLYNS